MDQPAYFRIKAVAVVTYSLDTDPTAKERRTVITVNGVAPGSCRDSAIDVEEAAWEALNETCARTGRRLLDHEWKSQPEFEDVSAEEAIALHEAYLSAAERLEYTHRAQNSVI